MTGPLPLASEFPPATEAQWRALAGGVLKGGTFEKLTAKTYDDIAIQPIYSRAANAAVIAGRGAAQPWQIMQRVDHPDAALANAQALHDLENGATGLTLVFNDAPGARGFGLPPTKDALIRALDGVYLDAGVSFDFDVGSQSRNLVRHFAELVEAKNVKLADVQVRFGFDAADGRTIHDAGGTEAQELAYVLASGVAHLRALESGGIALDQAQGLIYARLSADADQFLTMAKFRAARLLWARIEQACGLTPKPLFLAAETAWRMLTQRDPNVNMLRATSAVFSAGLGGANSITVLPHTLALGLPDQLARRIARNTQLVLLEESNLAKVADPAAGAGGIEALTTQLCKSAWALFQEIERAGGIVAALEQRLLQTKVAATRAARMANIAKRRDPLTGLSEFPNLNESATPVADHVTNSISFKDNAFEPIRLAEPFERLRDASDAILAKTGARPKIYLTTLGTAADFTARTQFAKSFFEAGGIEAVETPSPLPAGERSGAQQPGEGVSDDPSQVHNPSPAHSPAARERPLPMGEALVCLCSSDKVYAEHAAAAAKALQASGAKHIYLAGRPGDLEPSLRESGVSDFIYAGWDVVATLTAAYEKLKP